MAAGLPSSRITKWFLPKSPSKRAPQPFAAGDLRAAHLRRRLGRPRKILLGTYGSESLAKPGAALAEAKSLQHATLVVCFIRQVALNYKFDDRQLTIDTDLWRP